MKFSEINKQTATEALSNNRMFSNLIKDNDMFFEKIIDYSRSHKHFPDHLEKEDIKQELYISFLKALKKFRTESKCKFSTFAWTVLNNDLKLLKNESNIYQYLHGCQGIPYVKWFGKDENNYYMVINLLGESLQDYFNN